MMGLSSEEENSILIDEIISLPQMDPIHGDVSLYQSVRKLFSKMS